MAATLAGLKLVVHKGLLDGLGLARRGQDLNHLRNLSDRAHRLQLLMIDLARCPLRHSDREDEGV